MSKYVPFARSREGQTILQMHLAGIPFTNCSQVDLTPAQTEFFIEAINHMQQEIENNKNSKVQGSADTKSLLKAQVEQRRR
ncbi:MAG: hypothetical protein QMD71_06280 [bacterium]|nr:hypothetical protein [bacterium]